MRISRFVRSLAALVVGASVTTGRADDDLAELRARLDAVEQQNALLLERLERAEAVKERETGIIPAGVTLNEPPCLNPMDCAPGVGAGAHANGGGSTDDPLTMTVIWSHGLEAHTRDKRFRVHIGGRTQVDAIWLENDTAAFAGAGGAGDDDAVDIRRARVKVDGTMFGFIDWAFQCDFVNSDNMNRPVAATEANVSNVPAPTDVWVNIKDIPWVGNLRVGNYKEPIGFEHLVSSRYLDFLERSFNQDAFTGPSNNGFSPGVGFWNTFLDERGTWATGFFKNTTNAFAWDPGDGEYAWTSRVTFLPIYDEESEGANLFHLGLSGSIRDPNNGLYQVRSRGSLRNGPGPLNPVLVNSGAFRSDTTYLLGAEAVGQCGPLLLQAEYIANWNSESTGNGVSGIL